MSQEDEKKTIKYYIFDKDTPKDVIDKIAEAGKVLQDCMAAYGKDADKYWDELPEEQKLLAFFSVCKRIHQGDIVDQGSYRYVLYNTFGFGYDAYAIGMECGYLNIHNTLGDGVEVNKEEVRDSLNRINKKYGGALRRLADAERQERDSINPNQDVCGTDPSDDGA